MTILKLYQQFSVSLKFPRLKGGSDEINAFVCVKIKGQKNIFKKNVYKS
jgi:hypothetical protein